MSEADKMFEELGYECNLYDGDEPIPVNEYRTLLELIEKQQKEIENSVSKEAIRNILNHISYYLLGNLRYKDSQEQFEYLWKNLKEILGE